MNKKSSFLPVFGFCLALGGCSTYEGLKSDLSKGYDAVSTTFAKALDPEVEAKKKLPVYDGSCPPISVRPDLAHVADFYDPTKTNDTTKISEADITNVTNTCRLEEGRIIMQIDLNISGKTGPKARAKPSDKPSFAYPYFVAVTDSKGIVVSKEIFAASLGYDSKQNEMTSSETVFQNMPVPDSAAGETYNVVVGFQLSPEQLAYNNLKASSLTPMDVKITNPSDKAR